MADSGGTARKRPRFAAGSSSDPIQVSDAPFHWDGGMLQAHENCQVVLVGRGTLRLYAGSVRANGYLLKNTGSPVYFESPSWDSWVTLECEAGAKLGVTGLVLIQAATSPSSRPTVVPDTWMNAYLPIESHFQAFLRRRAQTQFAFFTESTFEEGDERLSESVAVSKFFSVAFCGAKGVGKSTCLRLFLNRLLSFTDCVAVLDADVGQPELSPPGILSLSLIRQPLLQPPYTHFLQRPMREPAIAYFYGSNTSQTDPERYLYCLRRLCLDFQRTVNPSIPLLVNLDGWVKGLGNEILDTILQDIMAPTHIIQIMGDTPSRMFHLHFHQNHRSIRHVCRAYDCSTFSTTTPTNTATHQPTINPSDTPIPAVRMSIPASSLRHLRLFAYFLPFEEDTEDIRDVWDEIGFAQHQGAFLEDLGGIWANRLAAMRPYAVPMETVKCCSATIEGMMDISDESLLWDVLNGAIVGLCIREDHNNDDNDVDEVARDQCANGNTSRVSEFSSDHRVSHHRQSARLDRCIGLGIIRAVDRNKRLYYVLTPLHDGTLLRQVNVFCYGSNLTLPLEATFRGVGAESFPFNSALLVSGTDQSVTSTNTANNGIGGVPPLSDHRPWGGGRNGVILGANPMKSRNTIARRSMSGARR